MKNVFGILAITSVAAVCSCRKQRTVQPFFSLAFAMVEATFGHEEISQNFVFDPGGRDLHSGFRGRQAELSEDR
jgi:hypothetical protein